MAKRPPEKLARALRANLQRRKAGAPAAPTPDKAQEGPKPARKAQKPPGDHPPG